MVYIYYFIALADLSRIIKAFPLLEHPASAFFFFFFFFSFFFFTRQIVLKLFFVSCCCWICFWYFIIIIFFFFAVRDNIYLNISSAAASLSLASPSIGHWLRHRIPPGDRHHDQTWRHIVCHCACVLLLLLLLLLWRIQDTFTMSVSNKGTRVSIGLSSIHVSETNFTHNCFLFGIITGFF